MLYISKSGLPQSTGGDHDTDAFHRNVAKEFFSLPAKTTPSDADYFVIEDSQTGFSKKKITAASIANPDITNIGSGIGIFDGISQNTIQLRSITSTDPAISVTLNVTQDTLVFDLIPYNIDIGTLSDDTTYKRFLYTERTKLAGIEDNADVTTVQRVRTALGSINISALQDIYSPGADVEDAVTKKHTQGTDTTVGIQSRSMDMGGFRITNIAAPILDDDAVRKIDLNDIGATVIHWDHSAEILQAPLLVNPLEDDDILIIERKSPLAVGAHPYDKRHITVSQLRKSTSDAYHYDVANEFSRSPIKSGNLQNDLFLLEDAGNSFEKKFAMAGFFSVPHIDSAALHLDISAEIDGLDEKETLDPDDVVIIEDSSASETTQWDKKKAKVSAFAGAATDARAIHYDGINEIQKVVDTTQLPAADVWLIGEYDNTSPTKPGEKIRFTFSAIPTAHDAAAVHKDGINELYPLLEKSSDLNDDWLILEVDDPIYTNRVHKKVRIGNLPTGGGGQDNTGRNIGSGIGVFDSMDGTVLQFYRLNFQEPLEYEWHTGDKDIKVSWNKDKAQISADNVSQTSERRFVGLWEKILWDSSLGAVPGLIASVGVLGSEVDGLLTQVAALEASVAEIQAQVVEIQGTVEELQTQTEELQTAIDEINEQYEVKKVEDYPQSVEDAQSLIAEYNEVSKTVQLWKIIGAQDINDPDTNYDKIGIQEDHSIGSGVLQFYVKNVVSHLVWADSRVFEKGYCIQHIDSEDDPNDGHNQIIQGFPIVAGYGLRQEKILNPNDHNETDSIYLGFDLVPPVKVEGKCVPLYDLPVEPVNEIYKNKFKIASLGTWYQDDEQHPYWSKRLFIDIGGPDNDHSYYQLVPAISAGFPTGEPDDNLVFSLIDKGATYHEEDHVFDITLRSLRAGKGITIEYQNDNSEFRDHTLQISAPGLVIKNVFNEGNDQQEVIGLFKGIDEETHDNDLYSLYNLVVTGQEAEFTQKLFFHQLNQNQYDISFPELFDKRPSHESFNGYPSFIELHFDPDLNNRIDYFNILKLGMRTRQSFYQDNTNIISEYPGLQYFFGSNYIFRQDEDNLFNKFLEINFPISIPRLWNWVYSVLAPSYKNLQEIVNRKDIMFDSYGKMGDFFIETRFKPFSKSLQWPENQSSNRAIPGDWIYPKSTTLQCRDGKEIPSIIFQPAIVTENPLVTGPLQSRWTGVQLLRYTSTNQLSDDNPWYPDQECHSAIFMRTIYPFVPSDVGGTPPNFQTFATIIETGSPPDPKVPITYRGIISGTITYPNLKDLNYWEKGLFNLVEDDKPNWNHLRIKYMGQTRKETVKKKVMEVGQTAIEGVPGVGILFKVGSLIRSFFDDQVTRVGTVETLSFPLDIFYNVYDYDNGWTSEGWDVGKNIILRYICINDPNSTGILQAYYSTYPDSEYNDQIITLEVVPQNITYIGVQSEALDMGNNTINNLGSPTVSDLSKAVNVSFLKDYVDEQLQPLWQLAHEKDHDDGTDPLDEDLDLGGDEAQGEGVVIPHRVINMAYPDIDVDHHGVNVKSMKDYVHSHQVNGGTDWTSLLRGSNNPYLSVPVSWSDFYALDIRSVYSSTAISTSPNQNITILPDGKVCFSVFNSESPAIMYGDPDHLTSASFTPWTSPGYPTNVYSDRTGEVLIISTNTTTLYKYVAFSTIDTLHTLNVVQLFSSDTSEQLACGVKSSDNNWLVGTAGQKTSRILRLDKNGNKTEVLRLDNYVTYGFYALVRTSSTRVYAYTNTHCYYSDDELNWTEITVTPYSYFKNVVSGWINNEFAIIASTLDKIYMTNINGTAFDVLLDLSSQDYVIYDVKYIGYNWIIAIGSNSNEDTGFIYESYDGGTTWDIRTISDMNHTLLSIDIDFSKKAIYFLQYGDGTIPTKIFKRTFNNTLL